MAVLALIPGGSEGGGYQKGMARPLGAVGPS